MKRISLLYTRAGGGHLSLSQATQEALGRHCRGKYQCQLFDPFPHFYSRVFKRLSTELQSIWKISYQATDTATLTQALSYLNRLPLTPRLRNHIKEYKPDIVISNNAFISAVLPSVLQNVTPRPFRIVHFADPFSLHQLGLIDKEADLYLSPTPEVTSLAEKSGIPIKKIKTIGWLSRQKFLPGPISPAKIRPYLGLDQKKFTLFIGGAGQGVDKTLSFLKTLVSRPLIRTHCQIIVNTGLNHQLASKILKITEKYPDLIHVVPYAHNMPQLLSASDLVIGKAGPNFLFESIHQLRPMFIVGCMPGNEEKNLNFISRENLGWIETDLDLAASQIEQLTQNPKQIRDRLPHLKRIKLKHLHTSRHLAWQIQHLRK